MEDITLLLSVASFILYGLMCLLRRPDIKPIAFFACITSTCAIASLLTENGLAGYDYFMVFPLLICFFGSFVGTIKKELDNGL